MNTFKKGLFKPINSIYLNHEIKSQVTLKFFAALHDFTLINQTHRRYKDKSSTTLCEAKQRQALFERELYICEFTQKTHRYKVLFQENIAVEEN